MNDQNLLLNQYLESELNQLNLAELNKILVDARMKLYNTMPELIRPQLEENVRNIKSNLKSSSDKWLKHTFVEVNVKGLSAKEYFKWQYDKMSSVMNGSDSEKEESIRNIVFPAHLEHYTVIDGAIVETLGGLPTLALVKHTDDIPEEITSLADDEFPMKSIAAITTQDGDTWGYGLSEFRETEEGSQYRLRVFWPQGSPQIWFDDHARHFSVEYRNFINLAAEDLDKDNVEVTYDTHLGVADDKVIDDWELIAARRAALNLKALI